MRVQLSTLAARRNAISTRFFRQPSAKNATVSPRFSCTVAVPNEAVLLSVGGPLCPPCPPGALAGAVVHHRTAEAGIKKAFPKSRRRGLLVR
jgi:hypothetical protein